MAATKVKKPDDLHVLVGEGPRVRAGPRGGAGRARTSSTSATRSGTSSPTSRAGRPMPRPTTRPARTRCSASACSTPRRSRTARRRSTRGSACSQIDENNRRAQDALKKLYVTEGRWDDLEEFYRTPRQDRRVHPRPRARGRGRQRGAPARARDEDRGALPRRDPEGRPRDARVREGALARREQPRRRRGADPALRDGPRSAARSSACSRSSSARRRRTTRSRARSASSGSRSTTRRSCATRARPSAGGSRPTPRITSPRRSAPRSSGSPARRGGWSPLVDAYAASLPKFAHKADALPLMLVMARVIEQEQGDVERALDMNRRILEIDEGNEQALDALERLYLGKGQFEELLGIYAKKLELSERRRRADRDPVEDRPALRGRGQGRRQGDRRLPGHPRRRPATSRPRCAASIASTSATSSGRSWPTSSVAQLTIVGPDDDKLGARRAQVPPRPGQGAAPRRRRRARSTRTATSSTSCRRTSGARGPRGPPPHGRHAAARASPASSSRSTSSSREWAPLVGVHEIQLAPREDTLRKRRCCSASASCSAPSCSTPRRRSTPTRARSRVDPSTEAAKDQLEALAALIEDGWARLVQLFERRARGEKPRTSTRASPTSSRPRSRGRYEDRLGKSDKAVEYYRKALAIEADDLGALDRARGDLHARREVPRAARDLSPAHRTSRSEPDERLDFLFRIASLHEEMLEQPGRGDRDLQRDPRPGAR